MNSNEYPNVPTQFFITYSLCFKIHEILCWAQAAQLLKNLFFIQKVSLKYKLKIIQPITKQTIKYDWLHSF